MYILLLPRPNILTREQCNSTSVESEPQQPARQTIAKFLLRREYKASHAGESQMARISFQILDAESLHRRFVVQDVPNKLFHLSDHAKFSIAVLFLIEYFSQLFLQAEPALLRSVLEELHMLLRIWC